MARRLIVAIALILVALSTSTASQPAAPPKPGAGDVNAHFINVGQGSAVLMEFDCGAALIDTGGEKNGAFNSTARLKTYLDNFFARRTDLNRTVDMVILTHAHIDHVRGLATVMSKYTVKSLVDNGLETGSGGRQQKAAHTKVNQSNGQIKYLAVKQRDTNDELGPPPDVLSCSSERPKFRFLWGALNKNDGWSKTDFENGNNSSVVTRVTVGSTAFLFPGDFEHSIQDDFVHARCPSGTKDCLVDVDFYHVSHHGSHNGTSKELLEKMSPKVAVLSMGPFDRQGTFSAKSFGHPRTSIINSLLTPPAGVSAARPSVSVKIANRAGSTSGTGPQFSDLALTRAIYGTGWDTDETVVFVVKKNGTFTPMLKAR